MTEFQRRVVEEAGNGLLDDAMVFWMSAVLWIGINTGLYRMNIYRELGLFVIRMGESYLGLPSDIYLCLIFWSLYVYCYLY
jgi:hypothetical protein